MSIEKYQDLFDDIWLCHSNQIWLMTDNELDEYYLDSKWENLWI